MVHFTSNFSFNRLYSLAGLSRAFRDSPGSFSLEHRVNHRGLTTHTSTITEVAYNVKYPLHLGGVKQWLKEDLLNSSML